MPQSLAQIYLHLVFSTKDRQPFIAAEIQPRLHAYLAGTLHATGNDAVGFFYRYERSMHLPHFEKLMQGIADPDESQIQSGGYVLDTLTAALWCLLTTESSSACVLKAVNFGGDTDTTGCVAGGLAGVLYGVEALPGEWLAVLPRQDALQALFQTFNRQAMD